LPVTEDLGGRVLGLPHFPGMQPRDVAVVAGALAEALRSRDLDRLRDAVL
jgi:dTDP-4-amino-4,6-dideoxygalactose transaminase